MDDASGLASGRAHQSSGSLVPSGSKRISVRRWSDATRGPGPYFGGLETVALFCAPAAVEPEAALAP